MMTTNLENTSMSRSELCPKIYVACLSSYTNGILYGAWIDAAQEVEDIQEQIKQLLAKSPMPDAEEIAVHAFEDFGSLSIGEYESIQEIQEKASFIVEQGELGAELLAHYGNLEDAREALDNYYMGAHESELDYAIHLFEECYLHDIPEHIQCYVDYEKFCRDIFIQDYFSLEVEGRCHVFMFH
jgi:antirestriction protein